MTSLPPFQHCTAFQMKFSNDLWMRGMYAPLRPQVNLFCTVKPMCHRHPHQPMTIEKNDTIRREMTMIAIA